MKFSKAMNEVKKGKKVRRRSWAFGDETISLYAAPGHVPVVTYSNKREYTIIEEDLHATDWEFADNGLTDGRQLRFGSLMVKGGIVQIPEDPKWSGDMISYDRPDIMITNTKPGFEIIWLHLRNNIYVCDRCLINEVSWDTLETAGYIDGKEVMIDNKRCRIRLMTGSNGRFGKYGRGCDNEWDRFMDEYDGDNNLTHYQGIYTWCKEEHYLGSHARTLRGYFNEDAACEGAARGRYTIVGFRPVLEILEDRDEE